MKLTRKDLDTPVIVLGEQAVAGRCYITASQLGNKGAVVYLAAEKDQRPHLVVLTTGQIVTLQDNYELYEVDASVQWGLLK